MQNQSHAWWDKSTENSQAMREAYEEILRAGTVEPVIGDAHGNVTQDLKDDTHLGKNPAAKGNLKVPPTGLLLFNSPPDACLVGQIGQ